MNGLYSSGQTGRQAKNQYMYTKDTCVAQVFVAIGKGTNIHLGTNVALSLQLLAQIAHTRISTLLQSGTHAHVGGVVGLCRLWATGTGCALGF